MKLFEAKEILKKNGYELLENTIQGLEDYSYDELCDAIRYDIEEYLKENEIDVEIVDIQLHGSRLRNQSRDDSDLDVVIEYRNTGDINWHEDSLFNALLDANLSIEGIDIDINPINADESGTMKSYMSKSKEYDDECLKKRS